MRLGAATLFLACAFGWSAEAADFTVTTTADSGAGSLRDAIASANGAAGADTVSFNLAGCPCVISLATSLSITDALTIGGPGMANLALDGGTTVQAIQTGSGVAVVIADLTIRNGRSADSGGGINAGGPLTLTRVTLQGNTAVNYGGGVLALQDATIVDSVFDTNTATNFFGGGLYANGPLTVTGSRFVNNSTTVTKGYGGGGGLIAFAATSISTTQFVHNTSADWGGGAYIADFASARPTPTVLTDVRFTDNTAQAGGGGGLFMWFEAVLDSVEATDNYAGYRGGGVYGGYAGNYIFTMHGGRLLRNSAAGGGGVYSDADIVIDGTEIVGNTSRNGNGGGVWTPMNANVSNVSVSFNVVLMGGNSGGIDTAGNLTINNSTVSDNQTMTGGGGGTGAGGDATVTSSQYLRNTSDGIGGGVLAFGSARLTASTFDGNTAANNWGGGVYAAQMATSTDTSFLRNTSGYAGGALAAQFGNAEVTRGRFESNRATLGGWGGAIYCGGPTLTVNSAQIVGNSADFNGGAIAANATAISETTFIGNQAQTGGGLMQFAGGTITNTLFARNHALGGQGEALWLGNAGSVRHATFASNPPQVGSAIYVSSGAVEVLNSIVTSHGQGIQNNAGTVMADYDLFFGNLFDTQGASITNGHPLAGDPLFLDPMNDDYHLQVGSPAIDAGPDIGVVLDIDGDPRPLGAGADLGYDEVVPPPTTTSTSTTTTTSTTTSTSTSTSTTTTTTSTSTSSTAPASTTTTATVPPSTSTTLPTQLLSGKKLLLKTGALNLLSKDAAVTLGDGPGSADDPTEQGGALRVYAAGGDGFDDTYPLAASAWRYLSKKKPANGYVFAKGDPVKSISIKPGKAIKILGKGAALGHSLTTDPRPVLVELRLGAARYCMGFGGSVEFTAGKKYLAKSSTVGEAACPP